MGLPVGGNGGDGGLNVSPAAVVLDRTGADRIGLLAGDDTVRCCCCCCCCRDCCCWLVTPPRSDGDELPRVNEPAAHSVKNAQAQGEDARQGSTPQPMRHSGTAVPPAAMSRNPKNNTTDTPNTHAERLDWSRTHNPHTHTDDLLQRRWLVTGAGTATITRRGSR